MVPPRGKTYSLLACVFAGQREPKCSVPRTLFGSCPRASITSISPEDAHAPYLSSCGNIHRAGQTPLPVGSFARNSNRPYFWLNSGLPSRLRVLSRAEVYPQPCSDSFTARMCKHAVLDEGVLRLAGVVLQFVVAPAADPLVRVVVEEAVADVEVPLRPVDLLAVELVGPDLLPSFRRRLGGPVRGERGHHDSQTEQRSQP